MLLEALSAARDVGRLHEIASVLIRHGLGDLIRRLGIATVLERAGRKLNWRTASRLAHTSPPQHVRKAFEELGPTFVKLGQILAGRQDLLTPDWTDELSLLHESAAEVPFDAVRERLTEDLGAPPEQIFRRFDQQPLAAASIAQVHYAELSDGSPVVVKVRRPGIRAKVEADLRWLARLAELVEREMSELRQLRPRRLVRQFERTLLSELDFREEAHNIERFADGLAEDTAIVVPQVYHTWKSERVLVLEYLEGPSIGEWIEGRPAGDAEAQRLARVGVETVLRTVLLDGFFHADPHPGNLRVLAGGRLGLLDFGMMGRLSEGRRLEFVQLLVGVIERRDEDVVDILLRWSPGSDADLEGLRQDCGAVIDRYHDLTLRDIDLTALMSEVLTTVRENGLHLPYDVALLLKVLLGLDSLGKRLDPDFRLVTHVRPFARRLLREYLSPLAILGRGGKELRRLMLGLPRDLDRLITSIRRGRLRFEMDAPRLDDFSRQLGRSTNRITVGLVTSALIVGTAIALTVPAGPSLFGLPAFATVGFAGASAAGVWLLWSIIRSGKR